jgi:pimeloyl-ACP methyl ester carboxylesterase
VPLNYSDPTGAHIRLAVSRIRHTARDYQGVVLVNPGGPGVPGLDWGEFVRDSEMGNDFPAAVTGYDWIGFDPRGVGASRPALSCLPDYFSARRPDYVPRTRTVLNAWLRRSAAYAHACEAHSSSQAALLENITTRDSALDMDSIRQALGQRQITYYGLSYGTYLGQVYATLFPSHVRRHSNVDPRIGGYQTGLGQDAPFNHNAQLWFRWLARHRQVFGLGANEGAVSRLFYATENRLRRRPAGGTIGPDEWADAFLEVGYSDQEWQWLGQVFSAWVHTHSRAAANELVGLYRTADTPGEDNDYAANLAVNCTDSSWPHKWSVWNHDAQAISRRAPFIAWLNTWFSAPCIFWPAPPSQPVRVNGKRIHSALLIDETLDGATPFEGSLEVRRLFPHAVLVAEPGGTNHAYSLGDGPCVSRTIAAYLATGKLPRRKAHAKWDKTCAPPPTPAASPLTRASPNRRYGRGIRL